MSRYRLCPTPAQEQVLADINAAKNIRDNVKDTAVGHTVAAREGAPLGGPANREPQRDLLLVG